MHMSLAGAANPFTATAAWRPNLHGEGHVLFLHLGDNLTLLMSPEEVDELVDALRKALYEQPVPSPV
jgi:hypothetical protein